MKIEGHLGEPGCTCSHVLTHLAHLWRGLDERSGGGDLLPVLLGKAAGDALDRDEVLHHVLLLVPRHHRLQEDGAAVIELAELRHRLACGASDRGSSHRRVVRLCGVLAVAGSEQEEGKQGYSSGRHHLYWGHSLVLTLSHRSFQ